MLRNDVIKLALTVVLTATILFIGFGFATELFIKILEGMAFITATFLIGVISGITMAILMMFLYLVMVQKN